MKKLLLLLITLTTLTTVSYASFPVDITVYNKEQGPVLLYLIGGGGLIALVFLVYWVVKKLISEIRIMNRKEKIYALVTLLLLIGVGVWFDLQFYEIM
tara:strand:- start:495 stop:788 length:294 start_codon:yes stop_codon:yes gene_type:complete